MPLAIRTIATNSPWNTQDCSKAAASQDADFVCWKQLRANLSALRERGDAVGGAEGQRFDGHGRLAPAGSHEAAAVTEKKIFYVMGSMIGVDHRRFRVIAHAAGAQQMHRELLFGDW